MKKGISLIVLIFTIVVMIVLGTISVILSTNSIQKAGEAKYKQNINLINHNLNAYIADASNYNYSYNYNYLSYDGKNNPEGTAKLNDGVNEDCIEYILGNIPNNLKGKILIEKGKLALYDVSEKEASWLKACGIKVKENSDVEKEEQNPENENYFKPDGTNGEVTFKNLKYSIDSSGTVTLNGKLTQGVYAMIFLDQVEMIVVDPTATGATLLPFLDGRQPIIEAGADYISALNVISGDMNMSSGSQFNFVLRDENNQAIANCITGNGIWEIQEYISTNIIYPYVYIKVENGKTMTFNNFTIKPSITKVERNTIITDDSNLKLIVEQRYSKGLISEITSDHLLRLNGKLEDKVYNKFTEGIDIIFSTIAGVNWYETGSVLVKAGSAVRLRIKPISGNIVLNSKSDSVNYVLRYNDNNIALNLKTMEKKLDDNGEYVSDTVTLTKDVTVLYLYGSKGIQFNNYLCKVELEVIEQ